MPCVNFIKVKTGRKNNYALHPTFTPKKPLKSMAYIPKMVLLTFLTIKKPTLG